MSSRGSGLTAPQTSESQSAKVDLDDEVLTDWSRSPSPDFGVTSQAPEQSQKPIAADDTWDAAQEMDIHAEEGEFARFLSHVRGQDLDAVRREIDEEIKTLNQQRKAAMRDSEDVTQHMISQIMVSFDIHLKQLPNPAHSRSCSVFLAFRTLRRLWRLKPSVLP